MSARPTLGIARHGSADGDLPVYAVDVTDRLALREAARGASSIIHCASYVGRDADQAWHVNDYGTRVLVDVCTELGIRNLVYISTTGVYGPGTHDGTSESAPPAPASPASQSRLSAEQRVLAAGGSVIRPHLTYGVGDRWFIPRLIDAINVLGGLPRCVELSTIGVDDLAEQVWMLHEHAERRGDNGVHNALHNLPATLRTILREAGAELTLPISDREIDPQHARDALIETGLSRHQADMVTTTNTFTSNLSALLTNLPARGRIRLPPSLKAWYGRP